MKIYAQTEKSGFAWGWGCPPDALIDLIGDSGQELPSITHNGETFYRPYSPLWDDLDLPPSRRMWLADDSSIEIFAYDVKLDKDIGLEFDHIEDGPSIKSNSWYGLYAINPEDIDPIPFEIAIVVESEYAEIDGVSVERGIYPLVRDISVDESGDPHAGLFTYDVNVECTLDEVVFYQTTDNKSPNPEEDSVVNVLTLNDAVDAPIIQGKPYFSSLDGYMQDFVYDKISLVGYSDNSEDYRRVVPLQTSEEYAFLAYADVISEPDIAVNGIEAGVAKFDMSGMKLKLVYAKSTEQDPPVIAYEEIIDSTDPRLSYTTRSTVLKEGEIIKYPVDGTDSIDCYVLLNNAFPVTSDGDDLYFTIPLNINTMEITTEPDICTSGITSGQIGWTYEGLAFTVTYVDGTTKDITYGDEGIEYSFQEGTAYPFTIEDTEVYIKIMYDGAVGYIEVPVYAADYSAHSIETDFFGVINHTGSGSDLEDSAYITVDGAKFYQVFVPDESSGVPSSMSYPGPYPTGDAPFERFYFDENGVSQIVQDCSVIGWCYEAGGEDPVLATFDHVEVIPGTGTDEDLPYAKIYANIPGIGVELVAIEVSKGSDDSSGSTIDGTLYQNGYYLRVEPPIEEYEGIKFGHGTFSLIPECPYTLVSRFYDEIPPI